MAAKNREFNPAALMGVGVCLMGSGAALTAVLSGSRASAAGIILMGAGVVFSILGFAKKRELESRGGEGDDDNQPPA
jgi:hypothetical protein